MEEVVEIDREIQCMENIDVHVCCPIYSLIYKLLYECIRIGFLLIVKIILSKLYRNLSLYIIKYISRVSIKKNKIKRVTIRV